MQKLRINLSLLVMFTVVWSSLPTASGLWSMGAMNRVLEHLNSMEYIGDVNLKSSSNRYISDDRDPNRPVRCWEEKSRNEEKWSIYLKPGTTKTCLRSDHGYFLRSYQDGTVRANSHFCDRDEEWEMVELPDDNVYDQKFPIALRSWTGHYFTAGPPHYDHDTLVHARTVVLDGWERLLLTPYTYDTLWFEELWDLMGKKFELKGTVRL